MKTIVYSIIIFGLLCCFTYLLYFVISKGISKYQKYQVKAEQKGLVVEAEKALKEEKFEEGHDLISLLLRKKPCLFETEGLELLRWISVRGVLHALKINDFPTAYDRIGWLSPYPQHQEEVRRLNEKALSQHYQYAHSLYIKGDYPNAMQGFKAILDVNPFPDNSREISSSAQEELTLCILGYADVLLSSKHLPDKALEVLSDIFNYSPLPPHVLNVSLDQAYRGIDDIYQHFIANQDYLEAFSYFEKKLDTFKQPEIKNHIFKKQTHVLHRLFENLKGEGKPTNLKSIPPGGTELKTSVSLKNNTQFPLKVLFVGGANEGFKVSLSPGKSGKLELWPGEYFEGVYCEKPDLHVEPYGKEITFMPGGVYRLEYIETNGLQDMIRSKAEQTPGQKGE